VSTEGVTNAIELLGGPLDGYFVHPGECTGPLFAADIEQRIVRLTYYGHVEKLAVWVPTPRDQTGDRRVRYMRKGSDKAKFLEYVR
jgi:hypothetical protein